MGQSNSKSGSVYFVDLPLTVSVPKGHKIQSKIILAETVHKSEFDSIPCQICKLKKVFLHILFIM